MKRIAVCVLMPALFWAVAHAGQQQSDVRARDGGNVPPDGSPVTLDRATQYDITSRFNGEVYRVMVGVPYSSVPSVAYPVLYVLDGNTYFATAMETLTRQSFLKTVAPAIVVGIGYPTSSQEEMVRRRNKDLTPTVSKQANAKQPSGGGDKFLRVIEEEVKPFVSGRYNVDRGRQIIWGHSLAGLLAFRALVRNPSSFASYVLSSPSIWWNDKEILSDEEAFSKRAREGGLHLSVLVTSAGDEQYRGTDPKLLAADVNRMVDNASELAERLKLLQPHGVTVNRVIFEGEVHNTVPQVSLSRALRFALPVK